MSESALQQKCVMWFWNNFPEQRRLLYMNHNNPKNRSHGAVLKGMGLVAGVADLSYLRNGVMHYIEMKLPTGKQSKAQIEWQQKVEVQGAKYYIVRSQEEFRELINTINQRLPSGATAQT